MVTMYMALTDRDWFDHLTALRPDEVNFWRPSGTNNFRAVTAGELFLFKLHSPEDYIVGGGIFSHGSNVPLSMAWESFGEKNGAATSDDMRRQIAQYRRDPAMLDLRYDPVIGCRILAQPFFWPESAWFPAPRSFAKNIVSGKRYGTDEQEGRALWDAVAERLDTMTSVPGVQQERFGAPRLVRPRLGQGAFRLSVTDAYERRCAVSGEKTLPILDAAHIKSYAAGGEHEQSNGLLLRTDIHRLFDLGYVTIAPDHRFEVSPRLKADFDNGKHYYDLHGTTLRAPSRGFAPPAEQSLAWHREYLFRT